MEKVRSPIDQPVDLAVVEMDGGRLQIFDRRDATALSSEDEAQTQGTGLQDEEDDEEEPRHGHWREDKIGVLMTMTSEVSATDPCPEIPEHFVDPTRILKLVREIKSGVSVAERDESEATEDATESELDAEATWTPRPELRTTVATRRQPSSSRRSWRKLPGLWVSRLRSERRSWPMGPRSIGRPTSSGSATSWRSWTLSTPCRTSSRPRWPGDRSATAGRRTSPGFKRSGAARSSG